MKPNISDLTGGVDETLFPFDSKVQQRGRVCLTSVDSQRSCWLKSASASALLSARC